MVEFVVTLETFFKLMMLGIGFGMGVQLIMITFQIIAVILNSSFNIKMIGENEEK